MDYCELVDDTVIWSERREEFETNLEMWKYSQETWTT